MKKRRIVVFVVIVAVIAAIALMVINSKSTSSVTVIKATEVSKGDIQTILSTNALIQSQKTKDYVGYAQYTVDKVFVKVGQKVTTGEVLLSYDLKDLQLSVEQAQIQLDNAVLNKQELLDQKEQIEEDIRELDEQIYALDGSSDPQDMASVQTLIQRRKSMQNISDEKIQLMDNSIALAKLSLESSQERLAKAQGGIVSEFDGVVTEVNAVEETTLSMAQPAFVVKQLDHLKGIIKVGKYDAEKIRLGQKVTLKNSNNSYQGTVSFIDPAAKKAVGMSGDATLQAEITIENADENLKIDFDINADILIADAKDVLTLPMECLIFDRDNNATVFTVKNGTATLTKVTLGIQSDTMAEIKEGLLEGDAVILSPADTLKDGTPVAQEGENNDKN